jgi:cell division protein FtsI/penicillin-binding protein 2
MMAVLVIATSALVACSSDEDDARKVLDQFLAGWGGGALEDVPFINPLGEAVLSADVATQLTTLSGELAETPPALTVDSLEVNEGLGTAQVSVAWPLPGGATWSYPTTVRLQDGDGGWRVIWGSEVVHPELVDGDELLLRREPAPRGEILGGDGNPLVTAREVVEVGLWPAKVEDLDAEVAALEDALQTIVPTLDLSNLPEQVEEADPDAFVYVITLRRDDYDRVRDRIYPLPGTRFNEYQRHLAPTSRFARALLGTVGEVTAEMIEDNPGVFEAGDQAGSGGLSQEYDEQLRGVPGQTVSVEREELELGRIEPEPGTDLQITLEAGIQQAAEEALSAESKPAALVAIRISDGAVVAVANTKGAEANNVNIALTGAVPPGSTFKPVSAYRLLDTGEVTLDTTVACPAELTVGGFTIGNAFSGDRGDIPFLQAVTISCNTAFAGLAPQLGEDGLATAGAALGLGGEWELGTETFTGSVPSGGSELDRAVAAFGQGDTLVSPVAMAAATAAIARGAWLPPTLVVDPEAGTPEPAPLNEAAAADVQTAMRSVVTDGTASALRNTPGGDVFGKTGTAEAGADATHGWFIGWQGDLAVAVFVEDGRSSSAAVPLAGEFFGTLASAT